MKEELLPKENEVKGRDATGDIFYAAQEGDVEKVKKLLDSGVVTTIADYDDRTPLHIACVAGHKAVVKLLLERGADVNARDVHDWTPLDEATRNHREEVETIVREFGGKNGSAVQFARPQRRTQLECLDFAASGNIEEVQSLVQSNIGVNFSDYDKRTPLHLAVVEGHVELAKWLIDNGADTQAEDRWGTSPAEEARRHAVRTGQDKMIPLFQIDDEEQDMGTFLSPFSIFYMIAEVVVLILFLTVVEYHELLDGSDPEFLTENSTAAASEMRKYSQLMDVHVMIFIGFGFLMTFLHKHGYNSLGLTFMVSTFVIQWHIIVGPFFHDVINIGDIHKVHVNLDSLIFADFCAAAVLITYGVLLGKVSPFQLLFIAILEVIFFSINEAIGVSMGITDVGGSMVVHMFGAFFGLACSLVMKKEDALSHHDNKAVYHSDIFAMIGTIFLWMFWPSFNGAMTSDGRQMRATVNTVLSLCGSCVAAFIWSHVLRREKKFDMVDIQNATLAGGVAMGTCADLLIGPGPAVLIGIISGIISVVGYVYVQPFLETKMGLQDTCGVNNLHGMPSLLGAVAGVIAIATAKKGDYGKELGDQLPEVFKGRSMGDQALQQLGFIIITLAVGIGSGGLTGLFVVYFDKLLDPMKILFQDSQHWGVPEVENPYYFDKRGEIQRDPKKEGKINTDVNLKLEGLIEKVQVIERRTLDLKEEKKSRKRGIPLERMSSDDVCKWFETQGLTECANNANQCGIDGRALKEFGDAEYNEIGVPSGFKKKIFVSKMKLLIEDGYYEIFGA